MCLNISKNARNLRYTITEHLQYFHLLICIFQIFNFNVNTCAYYLKVSRGHKNGTLSHPGLTNQTLNSHVVGLENRAQTVIQLFHLVEDKDTTSKFMTELQGLT